MISSIMMMIENCDSDKGENNNRDDDSNNDDDENV